MKRLGVWAVVCLGLTSCTEPNPDLGVDGAPPEDGTRADACLVAPYCDGDTAVACGAEGLVRTLCSNGCKDGKCVGSCANKVFFRDEDGDGYGDSATAVSACDQPAGHVAAGGDCDDGDSAAHPGQTKFFVEPTKTTKTFDYNCDEREEQAHPNLASCTLSGGKCVGDGWQSEVPPCAKEGSLITCYRQSGSQGCGQTVTTAPQACR